MSVTAALAASQRLLNALAGLVYDRIMLEYTGGSGMDSRVNEAALAPLKQNKPSLVVKDLEKHAPADEVYQVLLNRGVFKWMAVRRGLVAAKDAWAVKVTCSLVRQSMLRAARHHVPRDPRRARAMGLVTQGELARQISEERGYRRGLEECRAEIRALCHSRRLQAPDNDREAQHWLNRKAE